MYHEYQYFIVYTWLKRRKHMETNVVGMYNSYLWHVRVFLASTPSTCLWSYLYRYVSEILVPGPTWCIDAKQRHHKMLFQTSKLHSTQHITVHTMRRIEQISILSDWYHVAKESADTPRSRCNEHLLTCYIPVGHVNNSLYKCINVYNLEFGRSTNRCATANITRRWENNKCCKTLQ